MSAPAFTAPTLTATQEADLETYKQVFEVLDARLADLAADELHGRIGPFSHKAATKTVTALQKQMSEKANALTGCPLGIWID